MMERLIYGVNEEDKQLFLFELKDKKNKSLGIISELFFYSCVINDLTRVKGKLEAKGKMKGKSYRGYHKFPSEEWEVCAYFLAPEFYSFMNKEEDLEKIIREMNQRGDNVHYGAIRFDREDCGRG